MLYTKRAYTEKETNGLRLRIYASQQDLYSDAVKILFNYLSTSKNRNIGLATGATFEPFYAELVSQCKAMGKERLEVNTFNLDEYLGLSRDDPNTYATYMQRHLFSKIAVEGSFIPNSNAADPEIEASFYENLIRSKGGIGLQYLGIGTNGHIGFNEPGTATDTITHTVELSESTISSNSIYFKTARMPHKAITMGIGTILSADKIVLIATGKSKSAAIMGSVMQDPSPDVPASALRMHGNATILIDAPAASSLRL